MYELRILSGLHRGATLPLHEETHTIGASDDADVVLVDDSIKERHATLSRSGDGWLLSAGDGQLFDAESNREQPLIDLMAGDFARIGDVWISIMLQDEPWAGAPPVPQDEPLTDEPFMAVDADDAAIDALDAGDAPAAGAAHVAQDGVAPGRAAPKRKGRGARFAVGVMATMVVLSAAYAMTSSPSSADQAKPGARPSLSDIDGIAFEATPAAATGKSTAAKSPDALRKAFRKRLSDADLLQQFDMTLDDASWDMKGALDEEDARRFDLLLRAFIIEHQIGFPVNARIVSHEGMLPFKIKQVISGANPNIVTQEGQRLFVGEEFRGMRLVAIQDNHLTFAGKRKIEMNW